jgi:hypothetical protein
MGRRFLASLCAVMLVSKSAQALEMSGGVGVGGILIGTDPRIAVTPHAGISWRFESGFALSADNLLNILPAVDSLGVGVYNQTSVTIGHAWKKTDLRIGPSLSIYSTPVCARGFCGRVIGLGPGGHAQVNVYIAEPLGVSVSANLDWVGGSSLALPGGVAAMVMIGPVLRWNSK